MADGKRDRIGLRPINWIRAGILLLAGIIGMLFVEGIFSSATAHEVLSDLANVFFVPGVLYAGFGGLSFVSAMGGFDSFGYIFTNFSLHSLLPTRQPKRYKTYYEYKTAKDEKGRMWFPHILILGGASIVVSVLFLLVSLIVK